MILFSTFFKSFVSYYFKGLLCFVFLLSPVLAQSWTVQVAAFADYREAVTLVDQFKAQGFDSYSEFFMQGGKQLVRVRVGCFESQDDALALAKLLPEREKLAVPLTQSATPLACVNRTIGFKTPANWGRYQETPNHIDFWASLSSVTAFIRFDGSDWSVIQASQYQPEPVTSTGIGYFREEASTIRLYYPNLPVLVVTSGTLIWQSALSAVILENDQLVAYQLRLRP